MPSVKGSVLKKILPIIYVVDVSGSMSGEKIAIVNEAMRESMNVLKEVSEENADADVKVGVLTFSSGAEWVTKSGLVSLEDFYWNDLQAVGVTDLGIALNELDDKMSRNSFLVSDIGYCLPVYIFMSDGGPTDNWKKAFSHIASTNRWFKEGRKIAIAIGAETDMDVLKELVGNEEAVVKPNNLTELKKFIKALSVSSSMLASKSRMVGDEAEGKDILKDAQDKVRADGAELDTGTDLQSEPQDEPEKETLEDTTESDDGVWDKDDDGWD